MTISFEELAPVCGHHYLTDALFEQGYSMVMDGGLDGKRVLEICCGEGDLAGWLAQKTSAEILGVDSSQEAVSVAKRKYGSLRNLDFRCGDAVDLSGFADATFDVIVGQATMHHLSGSLKEAAKEYRRLLAAGGKVIFIFEPMGHNPVVAAIRAVHNTRCQWIDESNLYEWIVREFAAPFSRYEVYPFSLLAYFCKALPKKSRLARLIYRTLNGCDQGIMRRWPGARKYAANFNVCFWR